MTLARTSADPSQVGPQGEEMVDRSFSCFSHFIFVKGVCRPEDSCRRRHRQRLRREAMKEGRKAGGQEGAREERETQRNTTFKGTNHRNSCFFFCSSCRFCRLFFFAYSVRESRFAIQKLLNAPVRAASEHKYYKVVYLNT